VAETLRDFGLEAEAHNNLDWDDLRGEINAGRPVIVWVIGQMWGGSPVEYEAPDGSTSRVAAFEHTMILIGYSSDAVQVVDAYSGQYQYYWLSTFLNSWSVLGNMAVFGSREATNHQDPAPETYGESYTVQQGDYLVALAQRFGTTWQEMAELNSVGYPYTIYPGQVLQLPGGEVPMAEPEPAPEPEAESEHMAEPQPAEPPPPRIQVVNFQVRLPLVHRNSTAPPAQSTEVTPTTHAPIETVIVLHSDTLLNFAHSIWANWHLLAKLIQP
jgi:LysM repeat protein